MKNIPSLLLDYYGKQGTSTCYLVKIVTKNGQVYGFTTLDANVNFDDGTGVLSYSSRQELRPQKIQESADFEVDNTDLLGWFSQSLQNMVVTGLFDFAEMYIYRVSYLRLELGHEVIGYGTVGEIDFSKSVGGKRKVEFRSLMQQLKQTVNELYSLTCRADFGDERCGKPLVWEAGSVFSVGTNPYADIVVAGPSRPAGYFDLGVIEVLSGPNAGAELEVESWAADGTVRLTFLSPFPFTGAETLRIRQDCDKTEASCIAYGNIARMRAEHMTPVQDQGIMVPGAYVKSAGSA